MDTLNLIVSLLSRRDALEESMWYAAPEEVQLVQSKIEDTMRRVVMLMGFVSWVKA